MVYIPFISTVKHNHHFCRFVDITRYSAFLQKKAGRLGSKFEIGLDKIFNSLFALLNLIKQNKIDFGLKWA
jgi:hypothetical protein